MFFYLILPFHTFELSVGAILYPLTFLLTDLIAEFYGKDNFCIKLAIVMNITVALIIAMMNKLNATEWSKIDNVIFNKVLVCIVLLLSALLLHVIRLRVLTLHLLMDPKVNTWKMAVA